MDRRSALASMLTLALDPRSAGARSASRELTRRFPGLAGLPWLDLARFPTPLEESPALARALGVGRLLIKRDDRAGATYGGSKLRKLELLLGDAEARGHRAVAAVGGVGSNQTLATAVFAKQRGLRAHLYLLAERPSAGVREHLLAQAALGAQQQLVGAESQAVRAIARLPGRPYSIPMGGSSPLGNVGFVEAGLELARQVQADVVYMPLGTGGSAVGLALGLQVAGAATHVVAVRTASMRYASPSLIRRSTRDISSVLLARDAQFPAHDRLPHLGVRDGFVGKGYAEPTEAGRRMRTLARDVAGLELDLTYSAKAMAALRADAAKLWDKTVVFWLSYDPRRVDAAGVGPGDLPRALRGYVHG